MAYTTKSGVLACSSQRALTLSQYVTGVASNTGIWSFKRNGMACAFARHVLNRNIRSWRHRATAPMLRLSDMLDPIEQSLLSSSSAILYLSHPSFGLRLLLWALSVELQSR